MSVLQKALTKTGLELQGDTLPKKDRKVKVFQRLIAAVRAAEAEMLDGERQMERELSQALRDRSEAIQDNLTLHERTRRLELEIVQLRLKDGLGGIESLTTGDRTKLLELARPEQNGSEVAA